MNTSECFSFTLRLRKRILFTLFADMVIYRLTVLYYEYSLYAVLHTCRLCRGLSPALFAVSDT